MSQRNVVVIATTFVACLILAGCGQKGALYLPNTNTTQDAKKTSFIFGPKVESKDTQKSEAAPVAPKDVPASSVVGSAS